VSPTCPTPAQLERLVAGLLDSQQEAFLEEHLKTCSGCIAALEKLTARSDGRVSRSEPLDGPPTCESSPEFASTVLVARLQEMSQSVSERSESSSSDALPVIPGYEVQCLVGRGGMGSVYKARQLSLSRVVALKILPLPDGSDPRKRDRFHRDVEAVARLQHPHIVQIFEVGHAPGYAYLSLEYLSGGSLTTGIPAGPVDARRAATIVKTLALAMEAAHRQGVIHGDLKPANVLLTESGEPKIADFGLAKLLTDGQKNAATQETQTILGTPGYMAPEQARARADRQPAGPLVDIYGLGAILYSLLSGRAPFEASSPIDTLLLVVHEEPIPLRRLRPGVPRDLEVITNKCLNKSPSRRYPSAADLAEDIGRFLENRPIAARPAGILEKAWRWCRRRPAVAATSALAFAATLAGLLISVSYNLALQVANQKLETSRKELRKSLADVSDERNNARTLNAEMSLQRAQTLGELGQAGPAVWWLIEALRLVPEEQSQWNQLIRSNLAAWNAIGPRLVNSFSQPNEFLSAALSHDGRFVVTAGDNGEPARIHDIRNGARIAPQTFLGVRPVALHPDGVSFAVMDAGGTIRRFRFEDGGQIGELYESTGEYFGSLVFSPDGAFLLARSTQMRVFDVETGRIVHSLNNVPLGKVPGVDGSAAYLCWWSPDSSQFWVSTNTEVKRFDLRTGQFELVDGMPPFIHTVSPRQDLAVILAGRKRVQLVRLADGRPQDDPIDLAVEPRAMAFHPDGATLAIGHGDGSLRLIDVATGATHGCDWNAQSEIRALAFSHDGRRLLVGGRESAHLLNLMGGHAGESLVLPHESEVTTFELSADGNFIITGTTHGVSRRWDLRTGRLAGPALRLGGPVAAVGLTADGERALIVGGRLNESSFARFWNIATGEPIGGELSHTNLVNSAAFHPSGNLAITSSMDHSVRFWEVTESVRQLLPDVKTNGAAFCAVFSPDGARAIIGEEGKNALLVDVRTHQVLKRLAGHRAYVSVAAFSPDGKRAVTGSWDGTARLWDVEQGISIGDVLRHKLDASGRLTEVAFSHDGRFVATAALDRMVNLWDGKTGVPVGSPLRHTELVHSFAFSPDDRWLATGSRDGEIRLWDVATHAPIGPAVKASHPAGRVRFTRDGSRLIYCAGNAVTVTKVPIPWSDSVEAAETLARHQTGLEMTADRALIAWTRNTDATQLIADDSAAEIFAWHARCADRLLADRAWDAAIWRLDRVLQSKPDDEWTVLRRAWAHSHVQRHSETVADLETFLRLTNHDQASSWLQSLVVAGAASQDWSALMPFADAWVALAPADERAFSLRAEALEGLGQTARAIDDAHRAADLLANGPRLLSSLEEQIRAGNLILSEALLEKVRQLPDFSTAMISRLVLCRLRRGDLDGYRQLTANIRDRLRANPNLSAEETNVLLWNFTLCPDASSEWDDLLVAGRRLVNQTPAGRKHQVLNTLGGLQCRAGQFEAAIETLQAGVKMGGGEGFFEDYVFLAICAAQLGRLDEARAYLKQSESDRLAAPNNPWSRVEHDVLRRGAAEVVGR
jgi:serine/threonine protein kinase/WD40 repeat protein/tetratricopeptide (TPR) repeat protein